MIDMILKSFSRTGEHLLTMGMNSSHSGNLSIRSGDVVYITRTGAMLADLGREDIVEVPLSQKSHKIASMEYPVHREIYLYSDVKAVLHCHPPHAMALSLTGKEIVPVDMEGVRIVGTVPVVDAGDNAAGEVSEAIRSGSRVVVAKGHGVFAAGDNLEAALHSASALEISSKVILLSP